MLTRNHTVLLATHTSPPFYFDSQPQRIALFGRYYFHPTEDRRLSWPCSSDSLKCLPTAYVQTVTRPRPSSGSLRHLSMGFILGNLWLRVLPSTEPAGNIRTAAAAAATTIASDDDDDDDEYIRPFER